MIKFTFLLLLNSILISSCLGQTTTSSDICTGKLKCGGCLQSPGCTWCSDPKYLKNIGEKFTRCNTENGHSGKCGREFIVKLPKESAISEDNPQKTPAPTIKQKTYNVKLGVGQKINITLDYTDPGNKPLDLYYLMDLSATMEPHKVNVQKLGTELSEALRRTTSDLQIGFGSFIDKPIAPYATKSDIDPDNVEKSVPTYAFRNHLKLTKSTQEFQQAVEDARISRNLDAPEGVLDAIMQAIECQDVIGWRNGSHHVLVVSTDGSFHIAGDGKLAGIVVPNDGKCHMENNYYTKSTVYDYPSISQVISKIREHQTHTIFAVTSDQVPLYKQLSNLVQDYAITEKFDSTSSNARDIIRDQYNKIRGTVELSSSRQFASLLQLKYFAKCVSTGDYIESNKCTDVQSGSLQSFKIELELLRCPSDRKQWTTSFDISPTSSTFGEKLRVNLNLACGCDCEDQDDQGVNNSKEFAETCSRQGTIRCGICHCQESYFGEFCKCGNGTTSFADFLNEESCKHPDSSFVCSNRAKCECGLCGQCSDGFKGKYCECNARACQARGSNLECSDKGTCNCDKCECKEGYTGTHCGCEISQKNCRREDESELCNGHGNCECNQCKCNHDWDGKYCDICVSKGVGGVESCPCTSDIQQFITCAINDTRIESENSTRFEINVKQNGKEECYKRDEFTFEPLEPIMKISKNEFNVIDAKKCVTPLKSEYRTDCEILFSYEISPRSFVDRISSKYYKEILKIVVQDEPRCKEYKPPPSPLPIVLGTSIGVVIIGILTLILWKIITFVHDRREYSRFEKERKGAKWDASGNPLYNEPISNFQNPAYRE